MIAGASIKVCGITRAADAAICLALGADWLGVNVWDGSPRFVPAGRREALLREIPAGKRVAVAVRPAPAEVAGLLREGFDLVQAHLDPAEGDDAAALAAAAPGKLWLAPRLADGAAFPESWLPLATTWVLDAHQAGSFGGTGKTGDWTRAAGLRDRHPDRTWLLAGGLGPETVGAARQAGFTHLDLNSKVELAPGLKSAEKLHATAEVLRNFAQSRR